MIKRNNTPIKAGTHSMQHLENTTLSEDMNLNKRVHKTKLNSNQNKDECKDLTPLVERAVKRSGLPYLSFVSHLAQSAFRGVVAWTKLDLERLLMTSEKYGLDPLNREVFMLQLSNDPTSHLVVVIGVDGWTRLINSHEQFEGITFAESSDLDHGVPSWIECTIYRRDRRIPLIIREYLCEVRGDHISWITHPRRMLRHKALVQCAKLAFGLSGLYDSEEAHRTSQFKKHEDRFLSTQKLTQMLAENEKK